MTTLAVLWALVGWCGTVPKKFPIPPPQPDPWPWKDTLIGIIGGIAGGFLVHSGLNIQEMAGTGFGALAGGRILSDIAGAIMPAKR